MFFERINIGIVEFIVGFLHVEVEVDTPTGDVG